MTLDEVKKYIVENRICIPADCWKLFMQFLGTQLMSVSSMCVDSKLVDTEIIRRVTDCMKQKIPQFDNLALKILDLNQFKHGVFERSIYKLYLVLAYISITYDDNEKLSSVFLSYASFMLMIEFKKRFRICNSEYMELALTHMNSKAIYRKYELNHIEIIKYIVTDVLTRYSRSNDDFVFRMMRLILARITQNLNTLAKAYYLVAKEAKQSHSVGQLTSTVSTSTLIQTMSLHFESVKNVILNENIRQKLNVKINSEILECISNNLKFDEIKKIIIVSSNTNQKFRQRVLSAETCSELKTFYNAIYQLLGYSKEFDDLFTKLQKECPKLTISTKGDVKKIISFILVLIWKMSVCGG